MRKIKVLSDRFVEVMTSHEMIKAFGENVAYVMRNGNLYVSEESILDEVRKFEEHLSLEEIAEDVYRKVRLAEANRRYKTSRTLWDEVNRAKCPLKLLGEFTE